MCSISDGTSVEGRFNNISNACVMSAWERHQKLTEFTRKLSILQHQCNILLDGKVSHNMLLTLVQLARLCNISLLAFSSMNPFSNSDQEQYAVSLKTGWNWIFEFLKILSDYCKFADSVGHFLFLQVVNEFSLP